MVYGCEAKAKTEKDRGNVTKKHCGEIHGLGTEQGVRSIRTNQELGELRQTCDMVSPTKIKSLEQRVVVFIMDQTQMAKNVFESKPGNGRKGKKRGEQVENGLWGLKTRIWRQKGTA